MHHPILLASLRAPPLFAVPAIVPQLQPPPLPLLRRGFIGRELLVGARAMAQVQHLLLLSTALANGLVALLLLGFPSGVANLGRCLVSPFLKNHLNLISM